MTPDRPDNSPSDSKPRLRYDAVDERSHLRQLLLGTQQDRRRHGCRRAA